MICSFLIEPQDRRNKEVMVHGSGAVEPVAGLFDIQRDMDLLTRRLTNTFDMPALRRTWVPAVDVFSREKDLVVRAELPGIDPESDLEVTFDDRVLTIRGEGRHEERTEGNGEYRHESAYGSFERSVLLPEGVKEDDIQAPTRTGSWRSSSPGRQNGAGGSPCGFGGAGAAL